MKTAEEIIAELERINEAWIQEIGSKIKKGVGGNIAIALPDAILFEKYQYNKELIRFIQGK